MSSEKKSQQVTTPETKVELFVKAAGGCVQLRVGDFTTLVLEPYMAESLARILDISIAQAKEQQSEAGLGER